MLSCSSVFSEGSAKVARSGKNFEQKFTSPKNYRTSLTFSGGLAALIAATLSNIVVMS